MNVRPLEARDLPAMMLMRARLFEDTSEAEHREELAVYLEDAPAPGTLGNQACFVAELDGGLAGFAEVMLRSHAEGCWDLTARGQMGVACLEAWWVEPEARERGVGRGLVEACASWARGQGSRALASDAELANTRSHAAHGGVGFREVERTVHFRLDLEDQA